MLNLLDRKLILLYLCVYIYNDYCLFSLKKILKKKGVEIEVVRKQLTWQISNSVILIHGWSNLLRVLLDVSTKLAVSTES